MNSFELETANLSDDREREMFFLRNFLDHTLWLKIEADSNVLLTDFPILDYDDLDDWLRTHDEMHRSIAQALNLGVTPDLTTLDFDDPELTAWWVDSHSQLHIQVNQTLGLL